MTLLDELASQREYLRGRIDLHASGWRRLAYWLSVELLGSCLGIRYGHPELTPLPGIARYDAPSRSMASAVSDAFAAISISLLTAIVGRRGFIKNGDGS